MVDYTELNTLTKNTELRNRVFVAVTVSAEALLISGAPNEAPWAASVLTDSTAEGTKAFKALLVGNKNLPFIGFATITDAEIQADVDALVPKLITAFNAA